MAAKKKPVTELTLADIGVEPSRGRHSTPPGPAPSRPTARPPKQAGSVVVDEGDAGATASRVVDFLAAQKLV